MISYVLEAFAVLMANRTRTILTLFGLVIGVMAIVAIQVAAAGMAGAVNGVFKGMNANTFFVFPKTTQSNNVRAGLHPADLQMLETLPGIQTVIPWSGTRTMVDAGHVRARLKFGGESDKRFSTSPVVAGEKITAQDVNAAASVCVISSNAMDRLFPERQPQDVVGKSLYIGAKRYVIKGVLGKAKLDTAALGFDVSNDVVIPYTTYYNNYQRGSAFFGLQVLGDSSASLKDLEKEVQDALTQTHGGAQYTAFDFGFFSKVINGFFAVVGSIVSGVGAVSLLVAGVGIMNIMLVSVTERTREIGIRKAVGGTRGQILMQFLVEALLLSGIGCLSGLVLGALIGGIADILFISRISGVTAPIPWIEITLIATIFATLVAVVFGLYPAYRASRLDPIEALRYE